MGITFDTVNLMVNNYKIQTYFIFEFIDLLIFILLALYLDQVFPNEFGQKKHPFFFLDWLLKKRNKTKDSTKEPFLEQNEINIPDLEVKNPLKPIKSINLNQ